MSFSGKASVGYRDENIDFGLFPASIKKLRSIFVPGSSLVCDISCTFGVLNRLPDETGQDASGNIPARMFTALCLYPVYGPTFTSEE